MLMGYNPIMCVCVFSSCNYNLNSQIVKQLSVTVNIAQYKTNHVNLCFLVCDFVLYSSTTAI